MRLTLTEPLVAHKDALIGYTLILGKYELFSFLLSYFIKYEMDVRNIIEGKKLAGPLGLE